MHRCCFVTLAVLAACAPPSPEQIREEKSRLRQSLQKIHPQYVAAVRAENLLIAETLAWLNGSAVSAPRTRAVSDARRFMDRWARVYFVPRHMHEQLRRDEYVSVQVRSVQQQMLHKLKRRYFELHDYQRYAQHASESQFHHTPPGRLPQQLEEFRSRLHSRAAAADEIEPLIRQLE